MTDTATANHIPGVGTVYLAVSDQDRALAFYRDVLGRAPVNTRRKAHAFSSTERRGQGSAGVVSSATCVLWRLTP